MAGLEKKERIMTNQTAPLPDPRGAKNENWAKKIERAKQAREAGQAIRRLAPALANLRQALDAAIRGNQ